MLSCGCVVEDRKATITSSTSPKGIRWWAYVQSQLYFPVGTLSRDAIDVLERLVNIHLLACRRVKLIDLPEEAIARIFSSLPQQSLCSVRLVCRAFRTASTSCIQKAVISTTCLRTARRQFEMLPPSAKLSAELHSVDALELSCLRTFGAQIYKLHICATCDELGCETQGPIQPQKVAASRTFAAFTSELARAARLTNLVLDNCEALLCEAVGAPLVANFSRLQELELTGRRMWTYFPQHTQLVTALHGATNLQKLILLGPTHAEWWHLLPALAHLPRLSILGAVVIKNAEIVTMVTALTQLTRLAINWCRVPEPAEQALPLAYAWATLLTELSRLQNLHDLGIGAHPRHIADLSEGVRGLNNLRWLHLFIGTFHNNKWSIMSSETDRAGTLRDTLQTLSNLTGLSLDYIFSPSDARILAQSLPFSLRYLSLIVGRDSQLLNQCQAAAEALAPVLSRLEGLLLSLKTQDAWEAFTLKLTACAGLQHLLLRGPKAPSAEVKFEFPSLAIGLFLSRLTGLTRLGLEVALDLRTAATDIPCIAQLTALQYLEIVSWRGSSARFKGRLRAAAAAHVRNIDLLPLARLRFLRLCITHSMRRMRGGDTSAAAFTKQLHDLQWSTGLPLAEIVDPELAFHGKPENRWYSAIGLYKGLYKGSNRALIKEISYQQGN